MIRQQSSRPIQISPGFVFGVIAVVFLLMQTFFVVDQTRQAIVLQFGKPVRVVREPGLNIKVPLIQEVRLYDKRILNVDLPPARVNLSSGQRLSKAETESNMTIMDTGGEPVIIDTFARYRIIDPLLFLQRLRSETEAANRIQSLMNAATRDILGRRSLQDILSPARVRIMEDIRARLNAEMKDRGVEVVDVRLIRADLTDRMQVSTVSRMISERKEQATDIRARGQQKAVEIKAGADRERTVIVAEGSRDAQIIRGEGDREAIKTYADALNKDPAFYAFLRSMEAYRNVLSKPDTQFLLSPDSGFLKHMSGSAR